MALDRKFIDEFLQNTVLRQQVGTVVRGAGFDITSATEVDNQVWGVYLKPNETLRELFGTTREILLWAEEFPRFQARTVERAQAEIDAQQPRLSDEFCIIVSHDTNARESVREVAATLSTEYLGLASGDVRSCRPLGSLSFVALLQHQLFSRDLYRVSTALTHARGFYGRQSLLTETVQLLRTGSSNVGIFGLRKMGKTSLLYRILDHLRTGGRVVAAHLDVQRLDAINPTLGYALWSVGEALADSNAIVRRIRGLRLFGKFPTYQQVQPESVPELFDHDLRLVLSHTTRQVVLLLDEVELMCPLSTSSQWGNAFVVFWRLLRGLHQQHPGRLSYLITGTNPKCTELNKLGDLENPAYNYFDVRYLPALTNTDSTQLLQQLGQRMGLLWNEEAGRFAFNLVGGHPFLLRALASTVHRSLLPRIQTASVTREVVLNQVEQFLSEFNSTFSQMLEVLSDHYPDEFVLLETLSSGQVGEFRQLAEAFPQDVAHLRGYGLLDSDQVEPAIQVEALQTWLQRRRRSARRVAGSDSDASLAPGDRIENYVIIAQIGHRGGFARVYKARRVSGEETGTDVAIKVFRSGLLSSLQREMDALEATRHPNIVTFIEHGKSESGSLYLVMEYLAGPSLKMKCDRATRLTPSEALDVLMFLTEALVALHPNDRIVETMRKKPELTAEELQELARARHGYIHRDIKPENVILVEHRGPVLIDFNISSEVNTPVRTLQQTPGYLPPDGLPPRWSADVDLYALGLTILQAAAGVEYDGANGPDLHSICSREVPAELCVILRKMTASTSNERFDTARELNAALMKCSVVRNREKTRWSAGPTA